MGTVHLNGPPDPPGERWCVACLMAAKQAQWEAYQSDIEKALAADDATVKWIEWPPGPVTMRAGEYRAVCGDFPQLGVLDGLCWDHVAGFKAAPAPLPLDTTTKLPPGLLKGKR
jgi:hypothetical protein